MQTFTFLDSAAVLRRVNVELTGVQPAHLDIRELTDTVCEQTSSLRSLIERAEHGLWKVNSWR